MRDRRHPARSGCFRGPAAAPADARLPRRAAGLTLAEALLRRAAALTLAERLLRRAAALTLGVGLLLGGCGAPGMGGSDGLGPDRVYWRAADRMLITSFRELGAVASDRRFVYAAGEQGVLVFDHRLGRFESPLTAEDGFPTGDPPVALAVDDFSATLWLVTRTGGLWSYNVNLAGEWRWAGNLPGAPPVRLAAHDGILWAQTGFGWYEIGPTSSGPMRVGAPPPAIAERAMSGIERLHRLSPGFRAAAPSLAVDRYLRRYEITGAAGSTDPDRWWLSTWGGGLYAYDDRMMDAEVLPFGSVGRGVSAIARGASGTWFGGDGFGPRSGVALAGPDLQRWRWFEAGREGAPRGPVHAIVETDAGVYFGAADGLYRLSGELWDRVTDMEALPSSTVRALEVTAGALWVGTDRGLARLVPTPGGALATTRVDGTTGARVNGLARFGDHLWIASERGLWRLDLRTAELAQPSAADPRLRGRVVSVAADSSMLYALAEGALLAWDGAAWSEPHTGTLLGGIGRPTHVATRDGVVWIAGTAGALALDPLSGASNAFDVPGDVPEGPVRQVLPVPGGVWFATPAGALFVRID